MYGGILCHRVTKTSISNIQSNLGGNVNSLEHNNNGNCEKELSYEYVSDSERLLTERCLNLQT